MDKPMDKLGKFYMRHRVGIHDLTILVALTCVLTYVAFAVDIFTTEGQVTKAEQTLELDEVLLLGVVLTVGLLIFGIRRYLEQRNEIRRRRAAERYAHELAFQDPLTSLANRRQFGNSLMVACASLPATGSAHAVLMLDLNGFKQINDSYGHGIGDEALIIVAQRLLTAVRPGDLVARLGGDEFIILAQHLRGPEAASQIAARIIEALAEPVTTGRIQHQIGTGIGVALIPFDADRPSEIMRKADVALYRAKAERRSAVRFFEEDMDRAVRERGDMERSLKLAMAEGDIEPRFRPTTDLRSGMVVGFEVFPCWTAKGGEEIAPERFLPAAEESGLIHELAAMMLRKACAAARSWPGHVTLAIDVLPSQIKDVNLGLTILGILHSEQFDTRRLELEVSESTVVRDLDSAKAALGPLRAAGVRITLDNFGTGYSNLYHMQEFKFDKVKIDRRFTDKFDADDTDRMVRALAGLGQGLGMVVSAEGIDGSNSRATLLNSGVQQAQSSAPLVSMNEANDLFLERRIS
ncbi:MAG: hypothetical protein JWM58_3288 [Rhizobium sp.]|nr:hypothetical protein [Rhizobium sp.]